MNRYLEKIASFESSDLEDFDELEKQAFFKAIAKMFSRKPAAPIKPPAPPKITPPKQPSSTPHNGNVPKLQNALNAERKSRTSKFAAANRTTGKPAWYTSGG